MGQAHHLVVTRVAIGGEGYRDELDGEWFEQRLELFRRYYAPTVNSQTDQRFSVLLCFDPEFASRAQAFRTLLEVPSRVVWTTVSFRDAVGRELKDHCSGAVITTGLDSDDGLAVDFIERVRAEIEPDGALNFADGLQYSTRTGAFVRARKRSNPFISLHSTCGRWVFDTTGHKKVADRVPTIEVHGAPMWLQVIHGGNVSNEFGGHRIPVFRTHLADRFPADFEVLQTRRAFVVGGLRYTSLRRLAQVRSAGARLRSWTGLSARSWAASIRDGRQSLDIDEHERPDRRPPRRPGGAGDP